MTRRSTIVTRILMTALLSGAPACLAAVQPEPAAHGAPSAGEPSYFEGSIALPTVELGFTVRLERGLDGAPSGTMDIPMQSLKAGRLSEVVWTNERLAFTLRIPGQDEAMWPRWDFLLAAGATEHEGTLKQAGMEFPASLRAIAGEPAGPNRPQLPVAPFPYEAREVTFENEAGGLTIAGTLLTPAGVGPFPCVVLITGSGPQDRDETLFEHKPFLVIADHLARHGIASLRCDDRGVGGTGRGSEASPDSMDLATDTTAALDFLVGQDGIDATRLGLIGHSEGALIGPLVAADDPRVSFMVMLAGPGVPGLEILIRQAEAMSLASGETQESLDMQRPMRERMFAAIVEGDDEAARGAMVELIAAASDGALSDEMLEAAVDGQMVALKSRWMRTFLTHDPRGALRRTGCPVLVLNGDLDLQVLHDQNVPEVERALREGGNRDVTVRVLPGLNHLFQPAETGSMAEYGSIETTFDPATLDLMTRWIVERTGPGGPSVGR